METMREGDVAGLTRHHITVFLVDDQRMVGEAVRRMLSTEEDIDFHFCMDPKEAFKRVKELNVTVILQDLVMPDVDGLTMVKFFRSNAVTRDVPLIVLSSKEEPEIKAEAFALGANDYLVKLPDRLELLARIRYHSRAYINLLQRNEMFASLKASQAALQAELNEAKKYVTSLLPAKLNHPPVMTDWVFLPSTTLGGDAFGYHWLDDDHFAIYLLDVCGHGVGAALLAVSAMNTLRNGTLMDVDFHDPGAVLGGLNVAFEMERHNRMYFTLWYGVFNRETRKLRFASGGHPPAYVLTRGGRDPVALRTEGMIIGGLPGITFAVSEYEVPKGARLYVFSDGVYEIEKPDGSAMMTIEEFEACLAEPEGKDRNKLEAVVEFARKYQGKTSFDDDFSLLEVVLL